MIVGLLRVKNEMRWIGRVIEALQPVCAEVLVFDDHSDDGTPEECERLSCTVFRSQFAGLDEARDKDFLLAQVWNVASEGDWCLMVDGDEELVDHEAVRQAVQRGSAYSAHVVYLWDRPDQIRVDRWYRAFRRPSLFRLIDRRLSFLRTSFGGHFHCSNVPLQLMGCAAPAPIRLLHYGYMLREDRVRKFEWYNAKDPGNAHEDGYKHMVIGDLFPADSRFKWAGPLELEPLHGH